MSLSFKTSLWTSCKNPRTVSPHIASLWWRQSFCEKTCKLYLFKNFVSKVHECVGSLPGKRHLDTKIGNSYISQSPSDTERKETISAKALNHSKYGSSHSPTCILSVGVTFSWVWYQTWPAVCPSHPSARLNQWSGLAPVRTTNLQNPTFTFSS